MARGINKVILVGNLGNDPDTKYTQGGMAITRISLATTSVRKDKDGNQQERTEWHRVVFFGKLGEIAGEYLRKGSSVYVEGSLRYDKYTGQDGVEKYSTDIIADEMQMLGGKGEGGGGGGDRPQRSAPAQRQDPGPRRQAPAAQQAPMDDFADDDHPVLSSAPPDMTHPAPTWLVTGGAGFIGGNFVLEAVARGVRVVNLDALTYAGNPDTLSSLAGNPGHVFAHGDIGDRELVAGLLRLHRPHAVVNLAAESHVDRSIDGPAAFVHTNVVGTLALLETVRDYWRTLAEEERAAFRFLHVSTDEVYGSLGDHGRFSETSPYAPNSPYSASKAASDHLVRAFHHTYGLPVLTTNCSNNYGPYQFPEKLIPLVIARALAQQPLPIYGDGRNVRDWLYVGDHCSALRTVLRSGQPGETYNVGGDAERDNLTVVETLCSLLDQRYPRADGLPYANLIAHVADRPGHDRRYAIDASKLQRSLDWKPEMDFEHGLAATVDWYLDNAGWVARVLDGSYRLERIGVAA